MQVEHKTEKGTVLFVKVPDDSISYSLSNKANGYLLSFRTLTSKPHPFGYTHIGLPCKMSLIGLASEIKEEQAKMMVDEEIDWGFKTGFVDYTNRATVRGLSSLESFESLIKFKNIKHRSVVLFKEN